MGIHRHHSSHGTNHQVNLPPPSFAFPLQSILELGLIQVPVAVKGHFAMRKLSIISPRKVFLEIRPYNIFHESLRSLFHLSGTDLQASLGDKMVTPRTQTLQPSAYPKPKLARISMQAQHLMMLSLDNVFSWWEGIQQHHRCWSSQVGLDHT